MTRRLEKLAGYLLAAAIGVALAFVVAYGSALRSFL